MSFKKLYVHVLCVPLCNRQDVQISVCFVCMFALLCTLDSGIICDDIALNDVLIACSAFQLASSFMKFGSRPSLFLPAY